MKLCTICTNGADKEIDGSPVCESCYGKIRYYAGKSSDEIQRIAERHQVTAYCIAASRFGVKWLCGKLPNELDPAS